MSERRAAAAWTSGSGTVVFGTKRAIGNEDPSWGMKGVGIG